MGTFNPEEFMQASVTDAMSTSLVPCPEGEYVGLIADEVKVKEVTSNKTGESYPVLTLQFSIDDPRVTKVTDRNPTKVRYEIFLDLNEAGKLDIAKGKNVSLGRLREAAGLNRPGEPFSFRMLQGKMLKVAVKHRTDGDKIYDEVKGIAPAG